MSFSMFFSYFHFLVEKKTKIYILFSTIFFSQKLDKLPTFMLLSLFYYNIYFFSKTVLMTLFSTFLGILTAFYSKPPFTSIIYAIWINKKILPKKWLFQCFFLIFIFLAEKNTNIHSFSRHYFFSLKLHKLHIFMLLSLFYDNFFFLENCIDDPFSQCFSEIYYF